MNEQEKVRILSSLEDMAFARAAQLTEDARRSGGALDNKGTELAKCLVSLIYKARISREMIEGDGYSERSYADGMSGRRMRSRTTGRFYSGDDGGMSGDGMSNRSYDNGGYSGHGDQQQTIQQMKRLIEQMEQS